MINVLEAGLKANNTGFNNSLAWNDLLVNIGSDRDVYFPQGSYYFKTTPNSPTTPLTIRGCGINNTTIIRDYSTNNYIDALFKFNYSTHVSNLGILSGSGRIGGSAIYLHGLQASSSVIRDFYCSAQSGGNWQIPLILYSLDPMGIRTCCIDNVELFAATMHLAWFVNPKGLTANISGYPAGGKVNHMVIQGASSIRPANIQFKTRYLEKLWLYNTDNARVHTLGNTSVQQNDCNNVIVY